MRVLPVADPGTPDIRSANRYLLWLARRQWTLLAGAGGCAVLANGLGALGPTLLGRAIDDGLAPGDAGRTALWALAIVVAWTLQIGAFVGRERFGTICWLDSSFRSAQVLSRHTSHAGQAIRRALPSGEFLGTVSGDTLYIGGLYEVVGQAAGHLALLAGVSAGLWTLSPTLGLTALLGTPVLLACVAALAHPAQRRHEERRDALAEVTNVGADLTSGLRVLRGIGGERVFLRRFMGSSRLLREAGVRVAGVQAGVDALQTLLGGVVVVALMWIGAHAVTAGDMTSGQLVAAYGYAMLLLLPFFTAARVADKLAHARVSARRIVSVLSAKRDVLDAASAAAPDLGAVLADTTSGTVIEPGQFTALVAADPADTALIADRLGRMSDACGVTWGGIPIEEIPLADVRRRIVVNDAEPRLFTGTLRDELDPWGSAEAGVIARALYVASGSDIVDTLPHGLEDDVIERGRAFSGGQRQRLVLARALVADPEILVLVDPTSAVDAATEERVARRLAETRAGRTTVVTTSSPLLLGRADQVLWLDGGQVAAHGTHRELLATVPAYRATVEREEVPA